MATGSPQVQSNLINQDDNLIFMCISQLNDYLFGLFGYGADWNMPATP
jgi:hypothetical protein